MMQICFFFYSTSQHRVQKKEKKNVEIYLLNEIVKYTQSLVGAHRYENHFFMSVDYAITLDYFWKLSSQFMRVAVENSLNDGVVFKLGIVEFVLRYFNSCITIKKFYKICL